MGRFPRRAITPSSSTTITRSEMPRKWIQPEGAGASRSSRLRKPPLVALCAGPRVTLQTSKSARQTAVVKITERSRRRGVTQSEKASPSAIAEARSSAAWSGGCPLTATVAARRTSPASAAVLRGSRARVPRASAVTASTEKRPAASSRPSASGSAGSRRSSAKASRP